MSEERRTNIPNESSNPTDIEKFSYVSNKPNENSFLVDALNSIVNEHEQPPDSEAGNSER